MVDKFFPIRTKTACPSKWQWSTLYLNKGVSRCCHRTAEVELTPENFLNFHNNDLVLHDRQNMLNGQWPESSCTYCKKIEQANGTSDRMTQLTIPNLSPTELDQDPSALVVSPTIFEVYFNNTCNLGCLYCSPSLSSSIDQENKKHGDFSKNNVILTSLKKHYKDLVPYFWQWFDTEFSTIKRLHVLGGEPLYQKDFDLLLDKIEARPNPQCILNVVTNLMVSSDKLDHYIDRFRTLLKDQKLKRIDITCSIDCWGDQQEYVRYGMILDQWEKNFDKLLDNKWLVLNINQTISTLTITSMPDLLKKLQSWRFKHKIGHYFSGCAPGPSYMMAEIFGNQEFEQVFQEIITLMPTTTDEEIQAVSYMQGIFDHCRQSPIDFVEIGKLITYLDEKDQRRNTNWETLFPWLRKYRDICGIVA